MAFSRPQFRLSTLLWITLAVAGWFGGMSVQREITRRDQQYDKVRKGRSVLFELFDPWRYEPETLLGAPVSLSETDSPKLPPDYRDFRADEFGPGCWPAEAAQVQPSPRTE
jgi:hypothetical protein